MSKPIISTVFSGGQGVGVGAEQAGCKHGWGNEYDPKIAAVAKVNGFDSIVADFLTLDPRTLDVPDIFHASPVCKNASIANNQRGETQWDIDCGQHVAHFIDVLHPKIVTIENVWQYRDFEAFERIKAALNRGGYMYDYDNLNAADYGVPQTRRRLILRATRVGMLPMLPPPERWVGWYEAIEDLIPTLPESQFAPWQEARLPEELRTTLIAAGCFGDDLVLRRTAEPANSVTSSDNQVLVKAFIVNTREMHDHREVNPLTVRQSAEPVYTLSSGGAASRSKAFIMQVQGEGGDGLKQAKEPMQAVSANHGSGKYRAFLVGDQERQVCATEEPSSTVRGYGTGGAAPRAWLSAGRVVKMTPRALARFQSFPDSYILPDKASLACTVIGNSVPPLLYRKIIAPLIAQLA